MDETAQGETAPEMGAQIPENEEPTTLEPNQFGPADKEISSEEKPAADQLATAPEPGPELSEEVGYPPSESVTPPETAPTRAEPQQAQPPLGTETDRSQVAPSAVPSLPAPQETKAPSPTLPSVSQVAPPNVSSLADFAVGIETERRASQAAINLFGSKQTEKGR